MTSIRELYPRFRHLIHEGFKFLVVGAIGTIVTFGVANALHDIGKYKAITIATILATVATFLGNRYWTFRDRQGQGTARESVVFFVLNGIGLVIYYGCIGLTDLAGLSGKLWYNAALVVGTALGTLFRFWSYRKWVWMAPQAGPVLVRGKDTDLVPADKAAPAPELQSAQDHPATDLAVVGPGTPAGRARHSHGPDHVARAARPASSRRAPAAHRRRRPD